MRKYVLDTNLYIRGFRNDEAADELRRYYAAYAPNTYLSSIVFFELLIGARTPAKAREIRELVAKPFRRTRRVLTPSAGAWEEAAEAIAASARRTKRDLRTYPKSLVNDYLLAASCREAGATLITDNVADFEEISRHLEVPFQAPWPS